MRELQRSLNASPAVLEGALVVDGHFGDRTEAALKRFQAQSGLPDTGVVDEITLGALLQTGKTVVSTPSSASGRRWRFPWKVATGFVVGVLANEVFWLVVSR